MGPVEGEKPDQAAGRRRPRLERGVRRGRRSSCRDEGALPVRTLEGGLKLTLLSPGREELAAAAAGVGPRRCRSARARPADGAGRRPSCRRRISRRWARCSTSTALAAKRIRRRPARGERQQHRVARRVRGQQRRCCAPMASRRSCHEARAPAGRARRRRPARAETRSSCRITAAGRTSTSRCMERVSVRPLHLLSSDGTKTRHPNEEADGARDGDAGQARACSSTTARSSTRCGTPRAPARRAPPGTAGTRSSRRRARPARRRPHLRPAATWPPRCGSGRPPAARRPRSARSTTRTTSRRRCSAGVPIQSERIASEIVVNGLASANWRRPSGIDVRGHEHRRGERQREDQREADRVRRLRRRREQADEREDPRERVAEQQQQHDPEHDLAARSRR